MPRFSLPLAILFTTSTVIAAEAKPVCATDVCAQLFDFGYMGKDGESLEVPLVTELDVSSLEFAQADDVDVEKETTFQVTRARYDRDTGMTTIKGLVVFPRTADYGESVHVLVYDTREDTLLDSMQATRTRGQRRINVETTVSGRHLLRNLEGRI